MQRENEPEAVYRKTNNKEIIMQRENKWQDRFDEKFTTRDWSGTRKLNMFCISNKTKESPIFGEDEDELVTQHKQFIQSEIDTARAEERERIVNEIEKLPELITGVMPGGILPFVIFGGKATEDEKATIYFQAFKDIIKLIKQ